MTGGQETAARLEEELMTTRLREVEGVAELKELRLRIMGLETQIQVTHNQLKRQNEEVKRLTDELDHSNKRENSLQADLRVIMSIISPFSLDLSSFSGFQEKIYGLGGETFGGFDDGEVNF